MGDELGRLQLDLLGTPKSLVGVVDHGVNRRIKIGP